MDHQQIIHDYTVVIICEMRGYAPEEVERWIVETNDDYCSDVASEYADISSRLIGFREGVLSMVCDWLQKHPAHSVGLHGQKRGLPTGWYLAEEITEGHCIQGTYREPTR